MKQIELSELYGKTVKDIRRVGDTLVIKFTDNTSLRIDLGILSNDRYSSVLVPRAFEADIETK